MPRVSFSVVLTLSPAQGKHLREAICPATECQPGPRRRRVALWLIDDLSRECFATIVARSLSGVRVVRELEALVSQRGCPHPIVSDNGSELTGNAVLRWAADRLRWHYIEPGKPTQNAFSERFNSRLREHCLNAHFLLSPGEARQLIQTWRRDYHQLRPHSSLGAPAQFADQQRQAALEQLIGNCIL